MDQGLTILTETVDQQSAAGNTVTVFGYSQSAIISSLYMRQLATSPTPPQNISFVLVGNEMNPDGGFLSRFPGLTLPSLGLDFYGATPENAFPTTNYTLEYDGFADFPRFPINFLADLNAGLGIVFVHTKYADLTQQQVTPVSQGGQAIELPTTSPTQHYYIIPTENMPLLEPLRLVPLVGTPLADLLQPALVLVNLGYGDPAFGWSTGTDANVETPFGLFPKVNLGVVARDLVAGVQQGINAFVSDIRPGGSLAHQLASISSAAPSLTLPAISSMHDVISVVQTAVTNVANWISNAAASAYATLLPTADILNAFVTSLPAYDINLFLNGISQALHGDVLHGLINAIGLPIAADVGLGTTAGLVEVLVIAQAAAAILGVTPST